MGGWVEWGGWGDVGGDGGKWGERVGDGGWGPFQARLWRIAVLVGTLRPVPGHSEGYTTDGPQRGDGGQNSVIGTASRRGPLPHWVGADPIRGTRNIQVWPVGCVLRTCCVRVAGWEPTPAPTALRHGVHRAGATRHARRTRRVQTPSPFKTTRAILFFLRDFIWCVVLFCTPLLWYFCFFTVSVGYMALQVGNAPPWMSCQQGGKLGAGFYFDRFLKNHACVILFILRDFKGARGLG